MQAGQAADAAGAMQQALVILGAAALVIPLFHRLRLSPVLGFMLVGLVLGPSGLGAWQASHPWLAWISLGGAEQIDAVAELGVVMLLFMIGLEMSLERLRVLRRLALRIGVGQLVLSAAGIAGAARLAGIGVAPAVVAGLALAMSSTAVVVQVLGAEGRLGGSVGRAALAVLLLQDLAVLPVMVALDLLGPKAGPAGPGLPLAIGEALAAVLLLVALGRLVLRPLFRWVARTGSTDLFMAACLLVVLATGLATRAAGLSMAMGALIAGLLLAGTEYRRQIEVTLDPFKGLLVGVFLIAVGLRLDLALVAAHPVAVLGGSALLVAGKAILVAGLGRCAGMERSAAARTGLLLGPGGEFSFVVLGVAVSEHVLDPDPARLLYAVTALTMASVPLQSWLGRRLFPARTTPPDPALLAPEAGDAERRVILAGFGRVGETVAGLLETHKLDYLALDTGVAAVTRARDAGRPVYYGDATQPELLRRVGLGRARALVVTLNDGAAAERTIVAARSLNPTLLIVARARDAGHAARLYGLGATDAVPETIEASLQLAESVLVDLQVPMGPVLVSIHERRAAFQAEIRAAAPGAEPRLAAGRRRGVER